MNDCMSQTIALIPAGLCLCDSIDVIAASNLVSDALSVFRELPHHVSALS